MKIDVGIVSWLLNIQPVCDRPFEDQHCHAWLQFTFTARAHSNITEVAKPNEQETILEANKNRHDH